MLELGVGAEIFRSIGILLWIVLIIGLCAAIALPKSTEGRVISTFIVLAIFFGPMLPGMYERMKYKQRYTVAKALFDERCKTAGEKIYRTVEGVEGIRLLNIRPEKIDISGQYSLDDQYGHDTGGLGYIASFLRPTEQMGIAQNSPHLKIPGYRVVSTQQESEEKLYTKGFKLHPNGHSYPSTQENKTLRFKARYAVLYEDISTQKDRDYWIAGGAIKIFDQEKNELVAERVGFLFDTGLGNTKGQRSPWSWARTYIPACPTVIEHNQIFVFKVLKPTSGE